MNQLSPIVIYGIKNCDSVKKARAWLDDRQLPYFFHDFRVDGLDLLLLRCFIKTLGVEAVLNQRSTSWRQLSDEQKCELTPEKAHQLMLENPTLIKRPILVMGDQMLVGFNPEQYSKIL